MKPARNDFRPAVTPEPLPGTGEQAPITNTGINPYERASGRYQRSYNELNDALLAIFEHIYLPQEIRTLRHEDGTALSKDESDSLWLKSREQFYFFSGYDGKGICDLHLTSVLPGTMIHDTSPSSAVVQNAITTFFSELTEYTAGIPGVGLDVTEHDIGINSPQAYLAMIEALCQEKNVPTAESEHARYALIGRTEDADTEDAAPKRGAYEYLPRLKPSQTPVDNATRLGNHFQKWAGDKNAEKNGLIVQIPEQAFRTMAVNSYGFREIGHIMQQFTDKHLYPLLSVKALRAAVAQDVNDSSVWADQPGYNLH